MALVAYLILLQVAKILIVVIKFEVVEDEKS